MGNQLISDVILTPLKIIEMDDGNVMHGMKKEDPGADGFGEAYFSFVGYQKIKAWKKHKEMTLNLVVPFGEIQFVLYDDRNASPTKNSFFSVSLCRKNYQRLTVPPGVWMGFKGLGRSENCLLNLANIPHDPAEGERCALEQIPFNW